MSTSLSVGQISTLIAAAVFFSRILVRNTFPLLMAKSMKRETNAATLGLLQQVLGNTDWPFVLQTDSTGCGTMDARIRYLNIIFLASTVLLGIAAIISPAGLYEITALNDHTTMSAFTQGRDTGVFGIASSNRIPRPWRTCGGYGGSDNETLIDINCPGSNHTFTITENATGVYQSWEDNVYNISIDISRVEMFQSGLADNSPTVSSFFNIQSRHYSLITSDFSANYTDPTPVDTFYYFQHTILDKPYSVIDGLVVDARRGGVGFRNHTVPMNSSLGMEWDEDLLFITPESACVDMNFTIEYTVPYSSVEFSSGFPGVIVDNGGIADFDPSLRPDFPESTQNNPNLARRAEVQGWWAMLFLMQTSPFNLTGNLTNGSNSQRLGLGHRYNLTLDKYQFSDGQGINMKYPHAFHLDRDDLPFTNDSDVLDNSVFCQNWNSSDIAQVDNFPVYCGIMIGAATQLEGEIKPLIQVEQSIQHKVYSCATINKVSIKNVQFNHNSSSSDDLTGLEVRSVSEKAYQDEADMPLWAIETPSSFFAGNIHQLWGLVTSNYTNDPNLTTIRSPHIYPPFQPSNGITVELPYTGRVYLPALTGMAFVTGSTYDTSTSSLIGPPSPWSGSDNLLLFQLWQNLSQSPGTAGNLVDLVWTTIASNYFSGSRGRLHDDIVPVGFYGRNSSNVTTTMVPTFQVERMILYNWNYAIPAFLFCGVFGLALICAGIAVLKGAIQDTKNYLSMLSAGRLLLHISQSRYPTYSTSYKSWAKTPGLGLTIFRSTGQNWERLSDGNGDERALQYQKIELPVASSESLGAPDHGLRQRLHS